MPIGGAKPAGKGGMRGDCEDKFSPAHLKRTCLWERKSERNLTVLGGKRSWTPRESSKQRDSRGKGRKGVRLFPGEIEKDETLPAKKRGRLRKA